MSNLAKVNDYLSRGIDVNTVDGEKATALMIACRQGYSAIVSRLVEVPGLDINYEVDGCTAAHLASFNGETECVRILALAGRVDWNKRDFEGRG